MADFATALRGRLIAAPAVSAVTTRVFWEIAPQNTALPYIRLQLPSHLADRHLKGDSGARLARVQIDSFAMSFGAAFQLAEVARDALLAPVTFGGVIFVTPEADAPTPGRGEDTPAGHIFWTRVDLRVWHRLV